MYKKKDFSAPVVFVNIAFKVGKEPVAGGSKDESTKVSAHDELDTKSNESKPVTPTEISTLLPDDEEPEARVVKRLARKPVR